MAKRDDASGRGLTRRELIRKGAIVGGTLAWATPVVQSLAPAANAAHGRYAACCQCKPQSPTIGRACAEDHITAEECAALCGGAENVEVYVVGDYNCINTRCTPA